MKKFSQAAISGLSTQSSNFNFHSPKKLRSFISHHPKKVKGLIFLLSAILLSFIFLLPVILPLSGCGQRASFPEQAISLGMTLNPSGSVVQEISFSMQTENLKNLGVKEKRIKEVQNNMISALQTLRNEFYLAFLVVYSLAPDPSKKIGESLLMSDAEFDEENDIVHFVIKFNSLETWGFYHGATSHAQQKDNNLLGHNLSIKLFEKTSSEGNNPFAAEFRLNNATTTTIGERYLKIYRAVFNSTLPESISSQIETPKFVYDYATPFSNLRSNAEICVRQGALYHNVWINDLNDFKEDKILLTITIIYHQWWYISALLLIIPILGILLIFAKIKK